MTVHKYQDGSWTSETDNISQEIPLEIIIRYGVSSNRVSKTLAINMRTQGHDHDLVRGFLITEGIIEYPSQIENIEYLEQEHNGENKILIDLDEELKIKSDTLERHIYTNSSCGVCSKTSVESVFQISPFLLKPGSPNISTEHILSMPDLMLEKQRTFQSTGGIHATAIFRYEAESVKLEVLREDVGRHNAMDKALGAMMNEEEPPFSDCIALVSGRASFELVQKAIMVGIPVLCSIGAPSTLAVELAESYEMTLIGFLRGQRFNVYSGVDRIKKS